MSLLCRSGTQFQLCNTTTRIGILSRSFFVIPKHKWRTRNHAKSYRAASFFGVGFLSGLGVQLMCFG